MPPPIATAVYTCLILFLFYLNRHSQRQTSKALWLPVTWLLINGSRPISFWLNPGVPDSAEQLLEGSPLDRAIYLSVFAAGLIVLFRRRTTVARFLHANSAILVFVLYCAVSITWSDYPLVAFKRWIKFVGDFVMVLIILTDTYRFHTVRRVFARVAFVLIPLSVLVIKYFPELGRQYDTWEGTQHFCGLATDKNMLGMTCLVYGLGIWWQFIALYSDKKGPERLKRLLPHAVVLTMVFWIFWIADSMTSLSCFIIASGLIVVTTFSKKARKPATLHLLVAAILSVSFSVLFLQVGGGALETMGRNPTLTGRTEIWAHLIQLSANPVVGTGFESFWLGERLQRIWATSQYLFGINEAHNGFLEVFLNLGWVGVILFSVLLVTGYRNVLVTLRKGPDAGRLKLALFVAAVVYSFTEAAFRTMAPIWTAFLLAITAVPEASSSPHVLSMPAISVVETRKLTSNYPNGRLVESGRVPPCLAAPRFNR